MPDVVENFHTCRRGGVGIAIGREVAEIYLRTVEECVVVNLCVIRRQIRADIRKGIYRIALVVIRLSRHHAECRSSIGAKDIRDIIVSNNMVLPDDSDTALARAWGSRDDAISRVISSTKNKIPFDRAVLTRSQADSPLGFENCIVPNRIPLGFV